MSNQKEFEMMEQVAAAFVNNYYRSLVTSPKNMLSWYGKDSFFASGDAPTEASKAHPIAGGELIKEKLEKLAEQLQRTKIQVLQVDWQPTVSRSVMVSVWGAAVSSSEVKHFHHSAVLSPSTSDDAFFIRNDIFQFLPQVQVPQVPEQVAVEAAEETPAQEASEPEAAAEEAVEEEPEVEPVDGSDEEAVEIDEESAEEAQEEPEAPKEEAKKPAAAAAAPATGGKWSNIVAKPAAAGTAANKPQRVMQAAPKSPQPEAEPAPAPKKKAEPRPVKEKEPTFGVTWVMKHDVPEEELKEALGEHAQYLVSARQVAKKDNSGYMVFADFNQDVVDALRKDAPMLGGRKILVTAQRQR